MLYHVMILLTFKGNFRKEFLLHILFYLIVYHFCTKSFIILITISMFYLLSYMFEDTSYLLNHLKYHEFAQIYSPFAHIK